MKAKHRLLSVSLAAVLSASLLLRRSTMPFSSEMRSPAEFMSRRQTYWFSEIRLSEICLSSWAWS